MNYSKNDGLNEINRVKLLMNYSLEKTLNENVNDLKLLDEQSTLKQYFDKRKSDYLKSHPGEVWDPNITRDEQYLDAQGKMHTKKIKVGGIVPLTPKNIGLRGTPFGFHPSEYPEYLKKVAEINKKYPDDKTTWYNPTTWIDNNTDDIRKQELEELKKQYFHEEFPLGITREDYQDWLKAKKTISDEQVKEFSKIRKGTSGLYKSSKEMPGSDNFLDIHNQNIKKLELYQLSQSNQSFKNLSDYIDAIFEYDPLVYNEINKGWLEKLWDDYGWAGELILWLAVDYFTEGLALEVSGLRQGDLMAKLIRIAGRSGFPVGLGIARSINAGYITEHAVMDFVFAILPWAHDYFAIAKTPSIQLVESIVANRQGLNLRNISDVKKYIKLLTEEEKYFFRKIAKLNKSQLENGLKKSLSELNTKVSKKGLKKVDKIGKQILTTTGKKIKPSMLKKVGKFLGRVVYIDLPAIEISKSIARKFGFLDKEDKVKSLEKEFKNKQGKDLVILLANALEVIKNNPELSANETIKKIRETNIVSNEDHAIDVINQGGISEILSDENGNPIQ
jgi:hypothetical protein